MKTKEELLEIKDEIEKAKASVSSLRGKHEYVLQSLVDQFGCATLAEAAIKSKKLEKSIAKLDEAIEIATAELEEKYSLTQEDEE